MEGRVLSGKSEREVEVGGVVYTVVYSRRESLLGPLCPEGHPRLVVKVVSIISAKTGSDELSPEELAAMTSLLKQGIQNLLDQEAGPCCVCRD